LKKSEKTRKNAKTRFFQKIAKNPQEKIALKMLSGVQRQTRNNFSVTPKKIISHFSKMDKNKNVQTQNFLNFCKTPFFKDFVCRGYQTSAIPSTNYL
jgi:hypothetical protein